VLPQCHGRFVYGLHWAMSEQLDRKTCIAKKMKGDTYVICHSRYFAMRHKICFVFTLNVLLFENDATCNVPRLNAKA
jgi:hypothetical protein